MRTWLLFYWERLRSSYWFVPAVMVAAAMVLAISCVRLDILADGDWKAFWLYRGGPEGARAVLATIAGSMMTVAGVVFSITIVALTLTTSQFGPRLLRNFIRDRSNQFVLGTFLATFVYCLVVLGTVTGTDNVAFVPQISVSGGILLALLSLGVLIYFIHHMAISIQVMHVIRTATAEMNAVIDTEFPDQIGAPATGDHDVMRDPEQAGPILPPESAACKLVSRQSGYVVAVNGEELIEHASKHQLIVELTLKPGQYIWEGQIIGRAWGPDKIADQVRIALQEQIVLSSQRDPFQDLIFTFEQVAEVAVRALSPGVNDPFTAIACIDRLGEGVGKLARRDVPSAYRRDNAGQLRLIARPVPFADIVDAAFDLIRQSARSSPRVLSRVLEALTAVAKCTQRPADRAVIDRHIERVLRAAQLNEPSEFDFQRARASLDSNSACKRPPNKNNSAR